MSKMKKPGQFQRMAIKLRSNFQADMARGPNNHSPGWSKAKKATTQSAPPGALEENNPLKENKDLILAIFGPSGSGKSHTRSVILSHLPHFQELRSFSTRPKREMPGAKGTALDKEYNFTTFSDFAERMRNKDLVNVLNYEDNWYGTDIDDIEMAKQGVLITDITSLEEIYDVISRLGKDVVFIYPEIPSTAELTRRHRERLDKDYLHNYSNPEEEFARRRHKAEEEVTEFHELLPGLKKRLPIMSLEEFLVQMREKNDTTT